MILKASDFKDIGFFSSSAECWHVRCDSAAIIANRMLREWLEAQPRIYGYEHKSKLLREDDMKFDHEKPHWSARLVQIEPIVQESEERKLMAEMASYLERSYPLMSYPQDEKYRAELAEQARKLLNEK